MTPCGCNPPMRICEEAARLWDAVADAHKLVALTQRQGSGVSRQSQPVRKGEALAAFDAALALYDAHLQEAAAEAAGVQAGMLGVEA